MSKLAWDADGERHYETGTRNMVLYLRNNAGAYTPGVAWNGITGVSESPDGAEAEDLYADDIKYLSMRSAENFNATVTAYTYPDEWEECDGSVALAEGIVIGQQPRKTFGLCYRSVIGNDVDNDSHGYKLHFIYGCTASPSQKDYATINDSPEAIEFSWEISTVPVNVSGHKPTSILTIDSTKVDEDVLAALETILYGDEGVDPRLPLPDEIASMFGVSA